MTPEDEEKINELAKALCSVTLASEEKTKADLIALAEAFGYKSDDT